MRTPALALLLIGTLTAAQAENWPRFRGTDGAGVAANANIPIQFGDKQNLAWKSPVPGPGNSSPIVWGDRVFVTSYSGYGTDKNNPGNIADLTRHLTCYDANSGKQLWDSTVKARLPEDDYQGMLREHGYASSTPVTDGESVYVFFGKSGAAAFDFQTGKQLWQTFVGQESGNRRWGSAASPVLYKDFLIVNASEESQSIRALDKKTGKEIWKAEAGSLELNYCTPLVVRNPAGRDELVVAVPDEVWGMNPETGKLFWLAESGIPGNVAPSVTRHDDTIFAFGGFPRQAGVAIKLGGSGDVTRSNVKWNSPRSPYIPTPVYHKGYLLWVDRQGVAWCLNAESGELVYQERLQGGRVAVYASPVVANDKVIVPTRNAGVFVYQAGPNFHQLAQNKFADNSEFNGTGAISNNRLFLRSNEALYCVTGMANARLQPDADQQQTFALAQ